MSDSIIKSWIRYWFYLGKWKFFKGCKPRVFTLNHTKYPEYKSIHWTVWDSPWPCGVLFRTVHNNNV